MDHLLVVEVSVAFVLLAVAAWFALLIYIRPRIVAQNRKGLFRFNDGKNIRIVDPIAVLSSLEAHPEFRIDLHPQQAEGGNRRAMEICVDAISKAFGVSKFVSPDQPGLTAIEMLRLHQAFEMYCLRVKKNSRPLLTSGQSSGSMSSPSSERTEKHSSASG